MAIINFKSGETMDTVDWSRCNDLAMWLMDTYGYDKTMEICQIVVTAATSKDEDEVEKALDALPEEVMDKFEEIFG